MADRLWNTPYNYEPDKGPGTQGWLVKPFYVSWKPRVDGADKPEQ
jgi:hypothetical protein